MVLMSFAGSSRWLCQNPYATIFSLHPNIPGFGSTGTASYMILVHDANHIRVMLLTDFPLHVAIFDCTRVEVSLAVLVMARFALALYP